MGGCNNFRVIDLGVMVDCDVILETAVKEKADIIGLSGLITPSLDEMVFVAQQMEKREELHSIPLLIGGATTSKKHAAVKICPAFPSGFCQRVLDASRAVTVCQALVSDDKDQREEFVDEIEEEYEEIREDYFGNMTEKEFISYTEAKERKYMIDDFRSENVATYKPPVPLMGSGVRNVKYFRNYSIADLLPFIDWNPFFSVFQLRGTYPHRNYPKLFDDKAVGQTAKETFDDAQKMLSKWIKNNTIECRGAIGVFKCNSNDDGDIEIYDDEKDDGALTEIAKLHGLRQQQLYNTDDDKEMVFHSLADFVAPKNEHGVVDYIGCFAVSAGFGVRELVKNLKEKETDDYSALLAQALADRLGEAMAEKMHFDVRREYWGYEGAKEGGPTMSASDLHKIKYQGIRPAPGYPSQPDPTEQAVIWKLLDIDGAKLGIELTEHFAMDPAASVSGLYFHHKDSEYFQLGQITKDQVEAYHERIRPEQSDLKETEKWIKSYLGYNPDQQG